MFTSDQLLNGYVNAQNYESGENAACFLLHSAQVGGCSFRKWLFNYVNPLIIQLYETALW